MRKVVALFVKYPFYANLVIAVLILAGGWAFLSMKKSFFPERASRIITVQVAYPGASPKEMEEGITTRIEEAVRGLVGIKEINSVSSENFATVTIETTGQYDLDETLIEVKNAVDGISSFPTAAERPIIAKRRSTTPAMRLGLYGDVDLLTLKKFANQVEEDFYASGVMSQISYRGFPAMELSVEVPEENLLRYELTFDQIIAAVSQNNRDVSAGQIRSDKEEILIRSRYRSVNPNDIGNIVIRGNADGTNLLIRDVGTVKTKFSEVPNRSLLNGKPAAFININKLPEEDLEEISKWINEYVADFNKKNERVKLEVTFDFLTRLNSRLSLLYKNGGIGLLLVIITLTIFLSFRLSLWVAWGIPASFLAMFILANYYGVTINMISLFGMILVIGILVDDGIVIGENIFSHFEKGKSPRLAAVDGTMEVMGAVVTSISTTIVAFSPLLFITGRMEFLFEMAFIVIFSLLFSLGEAFFVLPAHLASPYVLRRRLNTEGNKIRLALDRGIYYLRFRVYAKVLRFAIKWKAIFVLIPVLLIVLVLGMIRGGLIKSTFFPQIPPDDFVVNIAFTPGTGEKKTLDYLQMFDDVAWKVDSQLMEEFNDDEHFVEFTFMNLGSAFDGQENGAHAGSVQVELRDLEHSPISVFEIQERVRKEIGELNEADKFSIGGRNRWGSPVSISLLGKNLEELEQAKQYMLGELNNMPQLINLTDNNAAGKQEVRLKLKPKAYFLGFTQTSLANQVRQGFFGGQAQRLQSGKDELRVYVRYPNTDRLSLGQLENMKIKTAVGEYPLSELAEYTLERGPTNINRFNLSREIRINSDLLDPYAPVPPILDEIDNNIIPFLKAHYPGIRVVYQGQKKDSQEAQGQMQKFFGVAFIIMVIIIMIHFKSFGQSLIILMMIPLALIGAAWGHYIHGIPISMLSAWGMVALTGVIINDAVVFLSKFNSEMKDGKKVVEAAFEAGLARFRPIILTTVTTTIGLYPIILENSRQAQFLIPMAISLAFGVFVGTVFILLFFPSVILVLNDVKVWLKWLWTGKKPTREEVEPAVIYQKRKIE